MAYNIMGEIAIQGFDANGFRVTNDMADNLSNAKVIYINQCGYDSDKPKIATITNTHNTPFAVVDEDGNTIYNGMVMWERADFSAVSTEGVYHIVCGEIESNSFAIGNSRIGDVSLLNALKFMEMSRQDAWEEGGKTGYAWRDSHQFSFELNNLVLMYMADTDYWESLPWDVYNVAQTEYTELQTQDCPNIVWLMKFAVTRYYDWNTNDSINLHALIKGQIAYFLYIYPYISDYVDAEWYATIRDWLISIWNVSTCNKSWYEVEGGISHNLFDTQSKIGTVKGQLPPAYAVVPNLLMYDVCTRDELASANSFKTAAQNNIKWLAELNLNLPEYTKGQRMNEYVPIHALTWAYEMHPELCPYGFYGKIESLAKTLISRSNNKWDYTQYSTDGDYSGATSTEWVNLETSGGLCNNPGYVGMMGVYLALARIITNTDIKARLKELATSHLDHGYGRNPYGRHFDFEAITDFEGATLGWTERYYGGYGALDNCVAVLDGSPKKEAFPYNPSASTGYSEGWVAFNSAWNFGLAYLLAKDGNGIGIFS